LLTTSFHDLAPLQERTAVGQRHLGGPDGPLDGVVRAATAADLARDDLLRGGGGGGHRDDGGGDLQRSNEHV
jgi:hypothetical protein